MPDLLAALLLLAVLPGSVELLLVTLGGLLPARAPRRSTAPLPRLAVLVAAREPSADLAASVESLRACEGTHEVIVLLDGGGDDAAARAVVAGARVLRPSDDAGRGAGQALDHAFRRLLDEGFEAVAVLHAGSRAAPDFVRAVSERLAAGADAVQARRLVLEPGASLRTRLASVARATRDVLRPRGRDRLGWSAGLLGDGFALAADTLRAVPCAARAMPPDPAYHLRLVRERRRVEFAHETAVYAELPSGGTAAASRRARAQRARGGDTRALAPGLAREVLLGGRLRLLAPLLELLRLPLAQHALLLGVALALPSALQPWAAAGLALVALHLMAGLHAGGGRALTTLAGATIAHKSAAPDVRC